MADKADRYASKGGLMKVSCFLVTLPDTYTHERASGPTAQLLQIFHVSSLPKHQRVNRPGLFLGARVVSEHEVGGFVWRATGSCVPQYVPWHRQKYVDNSHACMEVYVNVQGVQSRVSYYGFPG